MYTAIQANNIASEKLNHEYYRSYKKYVRAIMRKLNKCIKCGDMHFHFYGGGDSLDNQILSQIRDELKQIGYNCTVGRSTVYFIYVDWSEKNNE